MSCVEVVADAVFAVPKSTRDTPELTVRWLSFTESKWFQTPNAELSSLCWRLLKPREGFQHIVHFVHRLCCRRS